MLTKFYKTKTKVIVRGREEEVNKYSEDTTIEKLYRIRDRIIWKTGKSYKHIIKKR